MAKRISALSNGSSSLRGSSAWSLRSSTLSSISSSTSYSSRNSTNAGNNNSNHLRMRLKFNRDTVYGREKEINFLNDIVEKSHEISSMVAIRGVAGSGKSSLVHSQRETWIADGCLVGCGKYEQNKSDQPFAGFIDALSELVNAWADLPEGRKEIKAFLKSVERDWVILRYVIPRLFQVAGIDLDSIPAQCDKSGCNFDRMRFALFSFVQAAIRSGSEDGTPKRRIVIFLDDMQWADSCTMGILSAFVKKKDDEEQRSPSQELTNDNKNHGGVVTILAYRSEEVDNTHFFGKYLQEVRENGSKPLHDIHVDDLTLDQVNDLISHVTRKELSVTMPLAKVVHNKTGGNSFFVIQFLQMLQQEGYLFYSVETYHWEWKPVEEIQQATSILSGNVADMVTASMKKLPPETQEALLVASCLGTQVPLLVVTEYFTACHKFRKILQDFENQQQQDTNDKAENSKEAEVSPAKNSIDHVKKKKEGIEFIMKVFDIAVEAGILRKHSGSATYEWGHDKIQQAAYSLIPEDDRSEWHFRIGKLLQCLAPKNPDQDWMIYMAAEQLNRGSQMVADKFELAKLDLAAAKISIDKAAYVPAGKLLRNAVSYCDPSIRWKDDANYEFTLELFTTLTEVEFVEGNAEAARAAALEVVENAKTLEDKFRAEVILIEEARVRLDYKSALTRTTELLVQYGMPKLSLKTRRVRVTWEKLRLRRDFPDKHLEDLPSLADATDPMVEPISILLSQIIIIGSLTTVEYLYLGRVAGILLQRLCYQHGVNSYSICGVLIAVLDARDCGRLDKIEKVSTICRLMMDRFRGTVNHNAAMYMAMLEGVLVMVRPFHESLDNLMDAHREALSSGDIQLASACQMMYAYTYLNTGLPLEPLVADLKSFETEAIQFHVGKSIKVLFPILRQVIYNFYGQSQKVTELRGDAVDQDKVLEDFTGMGERMTFRDMCIFRLMLAVHFNEWDAAEKLIEELSHFPVKNPMYPRYYIRQTYVGLAAFRLAHRKGSKKYEKLGKSILKDFQTATERGSINTHPVLVILRAEEHPSKEGYSEAIKICGRSGLLHFEALMNERLGELHLRQDIVLSEFYFSRALELYRDWNALGKVTQLKELYPNISASSSGTSSGGRNTSMKARSRYDARDIAPIQKFNIETKSAN